MSSCKGGACSSGKKQNDRGYYHEEEYHEEEYHEEEYHEEKHYSSDDDKCEHKKEESWSYPDLYSNWQCRKEKCKPHSHPGKSFKYDGVHFSRKCCPPLTNWIDLFNAPPFNNGIVVEEAEEVGGVE